MQVSRFTVPSILGRAWRLQALASPGLAANERREILGAEIKRARQAKGLSQERLGFESGLSRNYVSMVELGQSSPTFDALERICDALGLHVSELVSQYETAAAKAPKRKR